MPVLPVTARSSQIDAPERLRDALAALPSGATATVMVHGYRFCPLSGPTDPHRHILSPAPQSACWKAISWPRHLHLNRPGAGLGIGFGWPATGPLREVAARAFVAGHALARTVRILRDTRPDLQVNIIAHSLGARVALAALDDLGAHDVARMILLSGAEYRGTADRALAGRSTRVLNVTSGENALFDMLFRALVPAPRWRDRPLSAGLGHPHPRWIDLAIDAPAHRMALARLGYPIRPPATRICHWSGYLRPGLFPLYRAVFDPAHAALFDRLGAALPVGPAPQKVTKMAECTNFRNLFTGAARS
ncbi:alpha/beta hydrolase [Rhodophyticola sp.]|jgi:pimeloyl-ACP methyl ester carboxylesterase|uniref:alpha/beta hydrolase n=1 Tax=Rhodophyticola sp. TaxID=2680032 RepID=UPI003D2DDADE